MSATSSQPAIKFVTSRHLGTKWCGWFSTRPKALFEPLISSGHFDPLVSVVQFRPLIFHKSTGCFRPMILSSVWTKNTQNCVYLSCFLRLFFVFSSCLCFWGSNRFVYKNANKREKFTQKMWFRRTGSNKQFRYIVFIKYI